MFRFVPAIPPRSDLDWCWFLRRQGREGEAMERALHEIGVMKPGGWADWAPSTLTATGAPVEMVFSQGDTGLRLRTEVADPASDPTHRMAEVFEAMTRLRCAAPTTTAALRDVLSAAQSEGDLQFGAWLGLHQRGGELSCQIEVELPEASADLTGLILPSELGAMINDWGNDARATTLRHDFTTGQTEICFTTLQPKAAILTPRVALAQTFGADLDLAIASLCTCAETAMMPVRSVGFGLAVQTNGAPPVLTIHLSAADLLITDDRTHAQLRAYPGEAMPGYAALMETLPAAPEGLTHHGLIGLTAGPGGTVALSAGVAAPWHRLPELY